MKTNYFFITLLILAIIQVETKAQPMDVFPITNTSSLGVSDFEPELYTYDFIAPLQSELLCKNGHLKTTPASNLNGQLNSATYEDETGILISSGTIAATGRTWFIAEESIVMAPGFEASTGDFFSAELKHELDFCESPGLYTPSSYNYRFFTSIYGPRMTSSGGIITRPYDFHRGEDMVDKKTPSMNELPDLLCMCDGEVAEISEGGDEGKSLIVRCNAMFNQNPSLGNIFIAYRHLMDFAPGLVVGSGLRKGDLIGKMGGTGAASDNPHLHLSVLKEVGGEYINLHPMRVFNNAFNRHLNLPIDDQPTGTPEEQEKKRVNAFLLGHYNGATDPEQNWAIFRIAVPYNKTALRAILIRNGTYSEIADFEGISEERDGNQAWLDDPVVGQLKLFPYPFVRAGSSSFSAHGRYNSIKNDLVTKVPDHPGNTYAIPNEGIFSTPAYVIDIKATGLNQNFDPQGFEVDVLDIWGNGIRAQLPNGPARPGIPGHISVPEAQPSLTLYPNPTAGDIVKLQFQGIETTGMANINLYNAVGQLQKQQVLHLEDGLKHQMNISNLPAGLYFIQAEVGGWVLTQQLSVQR